MTDTLDPKRAEIARLILEARRLARELDQQVLDFLLESAMREVLGHKSAEYMDVVDRLQDNSGDDAAS